MLLDPVQPSSVRLCPVSDTTNWDARTASRIISAVSAALYVGALDEDTKFSVARYVSEHPSYEHYGDAIELGKVLEDLSRRVAELTE